MSRVTSSEPDTFRQEWSYPNEVIKTIPGAARFEVYPMPGAYKSGRPRYKAVFMSADTSSHTSAAPWLPTFAAVRRFPDDTTATRRVSWWRCSRQRTKPFTSVARPSTRYIGRTRRCTGSSLVGAWMLASLCPCRCDRPRTHLGSSVLRPPQSTTWGA